jgi:hypothetical protein
MEEVPPIEIRVGGITGYGETVAWPGSGPMGEKKREIGRFPWLFFLAI